MPKKVTYYNSSGKPTKHSSAVKAEVVTTGKDGQVEKVEYYELKDPKEKNVIST